MIWIWYSLLFLITYLWCYLYFFRQPKNLLIVNVSLTNLLMGIFLIPAKLHFLLGAGSCQMNVAWTLLNDYYQVYMLFQVPILLCLCNVDSKRIAMKFCCHTVDLRIFISVCICLSLTLSIYLDNNFWWNYDVFKYMSDKIYSNFSINWLLNRYFILAIFTIDNKGS